MPAPVRAAAEKPWARESSEHSWTEDEAERHAAEDADEEHAVAGCAGPHVPDEARGEADDEPSPAKAPSMPAMSPHEGRSLRMSRPSAMLRRIDSSPGSSWATGAEGEPPDDPGADEERRGVGIDGEEDALLVDAGDEVVERLADEERPEKSRAARSADLLFR